jgi:hypothetical protein
MSEPAKIIRTAQDALEAWDAGEPLTVFEVESEGASQQAIWAVAFDYMSTEVPPQGASESEQLEAVARLVEDAKAASLTRREAIVAAEVAKAAIGHGWAKMLQIHRECKPLTIQKGPPKHLVNYGG